MTDNIKDIYPLSPMQQGMLFHSIYAPATEVYTEQLACRLTGKLNIDAFREAWQQVVNRHDILRTAFVWEDLEEPLQVVHEEVKLPFTILDWQDRNDDDQKSGFISIMEEDRKGGIELTEAPLTKITLIKLDEKSFYFIWSYHHILFDGWGLPIILKEVFTFYEGLDKGIAVDLPLPPPYKEYIAWLQDQDMSEAEAFWKKRLQRFKSTTPFVIDRKGPKAKYGYGHDRFMLTEALSQKLHTFARDNQITINTLIQGAWAILLHKYSGEDDIIFGATVSGRPTEINDVESMIGLFINTLPVCLSIDPNISIVDWLKQIQFEQAELHQFEYSPLVDIKRWSDIPGDQPLFESIIVFENYPVNESMAGSSSTIRMSDLHSFERTNFPMTLVSSPGKVLAIETAYETNRFTPDTVKRIFQHLEQILDTFANHSQETIRSISVITPHERKLTVQTWNQTDMPLPDYQGLHVWFEKQAEETPDATALVYDGGTMDYATLNEQANKLAHYLIELGVANETFVGISLDRSPDMIISVLAVMKASAAYLPIDPDYPDDRISYMIDDSKINYLITSKMRKDQFRKFDLTCVCIDDTHEIEHKIADNPAIPIDPLNIAYIIYTSGSTGRPKGVLLHHYGAINLVNNFIRDFQLSKKGRVLQFSSFSFDASFAEIFASLCAGAALYLTRREKLISKESLIEYLNVNKITTATLPPSLLTLLPEDEITTLINIASVGDVCSWELANRWKSERNFINGYGPTECTVGSIWASVTGHHTDSLTSPIGRPIGNVKVFILDKKLNPAPLGVPGEIHIGGIGVGRGYYNRAELTAVKFIPDHLSGSTGRRLYKTGDLARWLPDGTIEFLGRIDFQVKLRGFRIELGEIETALLKYPDVKDAAVLARGADSEKQLVAYLVTEKKDNLLQQNIRTNLREQLPEYMIPSAFILMDEFPLTPNGKVDRKALPEPENSDLDPVKDLVLPRNPEEELIATIWSDVLKRDKIGVNNSFFDLGGHSLLATQTISRLKEAFDLEIPLKLVFDAPTIAEMAREIEIIKSKGDQELKPPIETTSRNKPLPLSFSQQRLWFLDQLQPGSWFNNIPAAVQLQGNLKIGALEQAVTEMIGRHESLRTTFSAVDGKPQQIIGEPYDYSLETIDLGNLDSTEQLKRSNELTAEDARSPFDLNNGPLFRAKLLRFSEKEYILLFNMHHIISDGWSMGIFITELATLYKTYLNNQSSPIPDLPLQYADYAVWQQRWLKGENLEKQLDFWRNYIGSNPPIVELPLDHPRPAVQTFNGNSVSIVLPTQLSSQLKQIGQSEGVTVFMSLLAVFQTLLHRYSSQNTILVGSPIANRTQAETENLIGFFVNNIVLRSDFTSELTFSELLHQVRGNTLSAYAHQEVPFEQIVDALQTERDMSHSPIFQVMFVFQNLPEGKFELPGLTLQSVAEDSTSAKFDLSLVAMETNDSIRLEFEYNTDLFETTTIERMQIHFQNLLEELVLNPDIPVDKLNYLSNNEMTKMVVSWNETETLFDQGFCVHQKFEQMVELNPEKIAVEHNSRQITYKELNESANQLAQYLQKRNVGPDTLVGISMERCPQMIIAIIGTLKAGAAFVPLDPTYPTERLSYMIEDSGLSVLLTQQAVMPMLPDNEAEIISLDSDWQRISGEESSNLESGAHVDNLSYVIYTSGSTGQPKGTMLSHRGLVNLANEQQKAFSIDSNSKVLQFASLSFDASVWETVMALLNGAALVLADRDILASGPALVKLIEEKQITTVTLPPSVLAVFPQKQLPDLETIVTAGEKCPAELVRSWASERKFFNAYGPTETTVCASMYLTSVTETVDPPIGKAIGNFQLYVLDSNWQCVPVGVAGELCVGGVGLARGYLHRPELTADKFIPNPFSEKQGERLYRTGDLVRYQQDGNIEFLGRIDQQVKVRGFRIELGEIEALLLEEDAVKDTVVVAREDIPSDKKLVAYIVCTESKNISNSQLRNKLREKLPEYMVPSAFVTLNEMPLTPNGKIDRTALPRPESDRSTIEAEYVTPRNEKETKIVSIVAELLHHDKVGIYDNFFELGGHSLLATQFLSRIKSTFNVELPLLVLFEKPTVAQIAEEVKNAEKNPVVPAGPQIKRVERSAKRIKRSDLNS